MKHPDLNIIPCTDNEMLKDVAELANEIWHEYFPFLLEEEQIDYMVDKFQSYDVMVDQVKHDHYHYYQIFFKNELVGYIGLVFEPDRLFLSKLYLKQSVRGQGLASYIFCYIRKVAFQECYSSIYLTCNKNNNHSLDVYKNWGFECIEDVVTDIGSGYVMDDYIYEYTL